MNQQELKPAANKLLTGSDLTAMLRGGWQWLAAHINIVNELNVFPVPDGDTGTNMALTMRAAVEHLETQQSVGTVAAAAAQGALMGARGNSGVILSQFLQGMARPLAEQTALDTALLAEAFVAGAEVAYQSVMEPVEGTILTVARAAADAARQQAASPTGPIPFLEAIVAAARIAQAGTPDLLPLLKEAGVTDSGGQGLVYILEGMLRALKGEAVEFDAAGDEAPAWHTSLDVSQENLGYDVQFLLQGETLAVDVIREAMNEIGWSTLVVGDERLVKVHLHTHDPGAPLTYGVGLGVIGDVVVENLQEQAETFLQAHRVEPDTANEVATIAVAPGQGLTDIFKSLGVSRVVSGGQTMNPSVEDLLAVVDQMAADNVLILPNNSNIILAAEQACTLANKTVMVIPTKTIPQGIAAMLSFNPEADLEANRRRMTEASGHVQSIDITRAVSQRTYNGFTINQGDTLALLNDDLVSVGETAEAVLAQTLARLVMAEYEILTIYVGQAESLAQGEALARQISDQYPNLATEVHAGGQPHAQYIISVE